LLQSAAVVAFTNLRLSQIGKSRVAAIILAVLRDIGLREASVSPSGSLLGGLPHKFDNPIEVGFARQNVAFLKPDGKGHRKAPQGRASKRRKLPQRLEKPRIGV
jgi:hypothetical protein